MKQKNEKEFKKFIMERAMKIAEVDTELPSVETLSDKWVADNGDCYYYDINQI